jgi:hypothetical protein
MTSIQVFDSALCYSTEEDDEVVMDKEEKRV